MVVDLQFKASPVSWEETLAFASRHHLSDEETRRFFADFHQPLPSFIFGVGPIYGRRRVATLKKIAGDLRKASLASHRALETMKNLMDATPARDHTGRTQEHPLVPLVPGLEEIGTALDLLEAEITEHSQRPQYPDPRDRRRPSADRERIVDGLLRFWARCGRPLTYTTDEVSKTRSGPLIDFLQDALKLLTDPPATLHSETLAQTIKTKRDLILFFLKREAEYAALVGEGIDPFD